MTEGRRIALNIAATYARSLYTLVIGLFCGRWTLMALGTVDYGLYGVIGGLIVFISFINSSFDAAIVRFYGVSIGVASAEKNAEEALAECRRWFTIATVLHVIMPLTLMSIGYPTGVWAIRRFLTIPVDRIEDCVWVFRFVCGMGLISMMLSPFNAMYRAKQYIAELTVYTFITATLNVLVLYYMVSHPGRWLKMFSFWTCLLSVVPTLIIAARAVKLFPECRFRFRHVTEWRSYRRLCSFVLCNVFCDVIYVLRTKGVDVIINKYFGPRVNAAVTVANTVNGHAVSLSGALRGAFQPAIVTAYGAGDMEKMKTYVYRSCRLELFLSVVFLLPLALELREVIRLWLKNPPSLAVEFCWCMMVLVLIQQSTSGFCAAINARGKIALYSVVVGTVGALTFPLAWLLAWFTRVPLAVMGALIFVAGVSAVVNLSFARALVDLSIRKWAFRIMAPILVLVLLSSPLGYVTRLFWEPSFVRVVMSTLMVEVVLLPCAWLLIFDSSEKEFVAGKIQSLLRLRRR